MIEVITKLLNTIINCKFKQYQVKMRTWKWNMWFQLVSGLIETCDIPKTTKIRAWIGAKELLKIVNKHWDIDSIVVYMSEGRIMQYRAFAVANWFWDEPKNFSIFIDTLQFIGFLETVKRRHSWDWISCQWSIDKEPTKFWT